MPLCMLSCSWSRGNLSLQSTLQMTAYHRPTERLFRLHIRIKIRLNPVNGIQFFISLFSLSLHREVCYIEQSAIILLEHFKNFVCTPNDILAYKSCNLTTCQSKSKQLPLTLTISVQCMPRQKISRVIFCRSDNETV